MKELQLRERVKAAQNPMVANGDGGLAVLLVEDDEAARGLTAGLLQEHYPSLQIFSAPDAELGLELYRATKIDIIITDIQLPGMGGIELAREIRSACASAEIIALTAYSDIHLVLDAMRAGIHVYLLKPLVCQALFEQVDRAIERISLEQRIQKQNLLIHKLSQAMEQNPLGMMITDIGGVVEYVNAGFVTMTGFEPEAILGRHILDAGPSLGEDEANGVRRAIERRGAWSGKLLSRKRSGRGYWESFSISPVHGDSGVVTSFVVVREDITSREKSRRKIESLNYDLAARAAELKAANRELESFNYTVAHDLRHPLATISTISELLLSPKGYSASEFRKNLEYIHAEILRLNRLVAAILKFSSNARPILDRRSTDLTAVARDIASQLKAADTSRTVKFTIADNLVAQCDPVLARVVMENLFENAWKHTAHRQEALIQFGSRECNGFATLFIQDNGCGFDPALATRLFEPFQRGSDQGESDGFGIGLATARRIVQRHGGVIWAEGEPGQGAVFYFTFGSGREAESEAEGALWSKTAEAETAAEIEGKP